MKGDAARYAAVAAMARVHKGGWASAALDNALESASLSPEGRAFAGAVFFGTAERLVTLDFLLAPLLSRPMEKLDAPIRAVLECGLYQILYMKVPDSAAVNESVKLARAFGKSSAAGMVNAVLRKGAALPRLHAPGDEAAGPGGAKAVPNSLPAGPDLGACRFADEAERVGVTWSVSRAVALEVMRALPEEYEAFLAASFGQREVCLRVNTLKTDAATLAGLLEKDGVRTRPGHVPGALYAEATGGAARGPLFAQGLYHVQGEASQVACAALGAAPGMRVLDVCAAPGGKSATLAEGVFAGPVRASGGLVERSGTKHREPAALRSPQGAEQWSEATAAGGPVRASGGPALAADSGGALTACDLHPSRVGLIKETLERLGITEGPGRRVTVLQNDATVYNPMLEGQDAVLADVPCSGLGVLAQKPDLRWAGPERFDAGACPQDACPQGACLEAAHQADAVPRAEDGRTKAGGSLEANHLKTTAKTAAKTTAETHAPTLPVRESLPAVQLKVLATAARYVKEGGRLVYATCTVRPQENAGVVRAFLAKGGWRVQPPPVVPPGALLEDGMMTLLPHRTGMDGFFVAVLMRI